MDGIAILKLHRPLKDNIQNLYFQNYDVSYCQYSLSKKVDAKGEVCEDVTGGTIYVTLSVLPTDDLMAWVFDRYKKYDGEITLQDAHEESVDKIYFEEARCLDFNLKQGDPDSSGVALSLTIYAERMIIGDAEYKRLKR